MAYLGLPNFIFANFYIFAGIFFVFILFLFRLRPLFTKDILHKVVLFGIPIFYFLMAVSFYLITYDSAQIKITILHVFGLFLITSWLVLKFEQDDGFDFLRKNFIFIFPVVLFLVSGILSFLLSPFPYASFNEAVKRFIYCALAIIFVNDFHSQKDILRAVNWLLYATIVASGYGLLQVIDFYFFPRPPAPGLDPFIWRQAFYNRILSTFGNPNFFGDFLITMGPIVLALTLYKKKILYALLWASVIACTYFTYSKGAWVATASGNFVFILLFVFIFLKDRINKKIIISAILLITILLSVSGFGIYKLAKGRMDSISFRVFTWLSTWDMINTNPVLGTGIGSFYVTYPSFRRPQIFYIEGKHNNESDHPENEYLEVWFDEGIIGFTIFLTLIGFVLLMGVRNILFIHRRDNPARDGPMPYIQMGLTAAFVAKLTHDATCVSLRFVSSGVMFWLLIGLTLSISVMYIKDTEPVKKLELSKWIKFIIQAVLIIFFLGLMKYLGAYFTADILHSRAITYSKMGQWEMAIQTYEEVSEKNPSFPMSRYFKGNVHLDRWKAGDPQMVEKEFQALWKLAPVYVQSKYLAGVMYSKLWRDALFLRNEYIRQGRPQNEIANINARLTELFQKALAVYNEFLLIDPIYPLTYYNVAALYADIGDLASAEKILYAHIQYPEILLRHPYDIWVDTDEQGNRIDWRSRVPEENAETFFQLGNLYAANNMFQPAINVYQRALTLAPNNILARKNMAVVYEKMGNRKEARRLWTEINRIDPQDKDALEYLRKN
ncbi:MAG: O-antigen ligase family protein [Elusimicrobiota bacterium]|jgi:putative inorganic carbon (HCO3(-)) transporter|nr:O-antigen ligase family protein [Elusimicrobiota bacterium]